MEFVVLYTKMHGNNFNFFFSLLGFLLFFWPSRYCYRWDWVSPLLFDHRTYSHKKVFYGLMIAFLRHESLNHSCYLCKVVFLNKFKTDNSGKTHELSIVCSLNFLRHKRCCVSNCHAAALDDSLFHFYLLFQIKTLIFLLSKFLFFFFYVL